MLVGVYWSVESLAEGGFQWLAEKDRCGAVYTGPDDELTVLKEDERWAGSYAGGGFMLVVGCSDISAIRCWLNPDPLID